MFNRAVGVFWLCMAVLFLSCNSALMYEGAIPFANTDRLKLILGAVAISTPWILAVLPFQAGISMRETWFGLRRPTSWHVVIFAAYGVFIAYNVLNGSNALTGSRVSIVAEKQKGADDVQALRDQRAALIVQQKNLPAFRPADTTWALIEAEKKSKLWTKTKECSAATATDSRKFCANLQTLESEAASAEAGAELQSKISAIDTALKAADATSAEADPQADAIARWLKTTPQNVRAGIGMLGPLALEFGALVFLAFSGKSFGWTHRGPQAPVGPPVPVKPAALIPSPEVLRRAPAASLEALTAQRKLCEWFFRECTRPVAAGAMPESEWYQHYESICNRSQDAPLPIENFRRIAASFIPRMHPIEGAWHYFERLPYIPENA